MRHEKEAYQNCIAIYRIYTVIEAGVASELGQFLWV